MAKLTGGLIITDDEQIELLSHMRKKKKITLTFGHHEINLKIESMQTSVGHGSMKSTIQFSQIVDHDKMAGLSKSRCATIGEDHIRDARTEHKD